MKDEYISTFIFLLLLFTVLRGCSVSLNQRDPKTGKEICQYTLSFKMIEDKDIDH